MDTVKTPPVDTLGNALPREMARVRDKVMSAFLAIGPPGAFALAFMRADLDKATKVLAEGDIVAMLAAYQSLRDYEV